MAAVGIAAAGLAFNIALPLLKKLYSLAKREYKDLSSVVDGVSELKRLLQEVEELLSLREENQPKHWLDKRLSAVEDASDFINSWDTEYRQWKAKKQVLKIVPPVSFMANSSKELKKITDTLTKIIEEGENMKTGFTKTDAPATRETVSELPNGFVGRESEKNSLIDQLINEEESSDADNVSFIRVVGKGGLGKTYLAQLLYQQFSAPEYFNHFDLRFWVCVTEKFDIKKICKDIVVSDMLQKNENFGSISSLSLNALHTRVGQILSGKKFLIVLDDIWTYRIRDMDKLVSALRLGGKGSKVLVTSRTADVLNVECSKTPTNLQILTEENSRLLFEELAFGRVGVRQGFEVYGRKIVKRCDGLPLAIKFMAALVRGKNVGVWKRIAESKTWERNDDEVLPALRLSYNRLPSEAHKKCFAFCALYPKSFLFVKDEMVKLWMAEGFVQEDDDLQKIEDVGVKYFDDLTGRFFFEPSNEDVEKYKMHDLIHDLAESVSKPFSSRVIENDEPASETFTEKTRHVSLLGQHVGKPTLDIIKKSKKLRTILYPVQRVRPFGRSHLVPAQDLRNLGKADMFHSGGHIRVLDLSCSTLEKLPDSIGAMKLLHYLDVSKTEVRGIPDSICNLLNLQTLKVSGCPYVFIFPKKFSKLVNLRHLELDEMFWRTLKTIPQSMGCIPNLHNLHVQISGSTAGYKLEELKNMNYLTGPLHISNLENAVHAAEANLTEKKNLDKVVYEWSNSDPNLPVDEAFENQILEDLQPPPKITELKICHYRGTTIPSWIQGGQFQFRDLATIILRDCGRIKTLSLGNLPNVTEVQLENMKELEEWREEEYQSLDLSRVNEKEYQPIKRLTISSCPNLTNLPCCFSKLFVLDITKCNKLQHVPFGPMSYVTLEDNDVMKRWGEEHEEIWRQLKELERGLESQSIPLSEQLQVISENLKKIGETLYYEFPAKLINLKIRNCPEMCALPKVFAPQKLEISGCKSLTTLPDERMSKRYRQLSLDSCDDATLLGTLPNSPTLLSLVISSISAGLRCFPKLPSLPQLQTLHIHNCADLEYLSTEEYRFFEEGFTSLHVLSIKNCPKLLTLPSEGLPTSIQYLSIGACKSLTSFGPPDVLKKLNSLHDLSIEDCPALQSLPVDGLPNSILHLRIQGCPSLTKACGKDGTYRPHISEDLDLELMGETSAGTWFKRLTKH